MKHVEHRTHDLVSNVQLSNNFFFWCFYLHITLNSGSTPGFLKDVYKKSGAPGEMFSSSDWRLPRTVGDLFVHFFGCFVWVTSVRELKC